MRYECPKENKRRFLARYSLATMADRVGTGQLDWSNFCCVFPGLLTNLPKMDGHKHPLGEMPGVRKPKSGFESGRRVPCCELHAHLWASKRTQWSPRWQVLKRDDSYVESPAGRSLGISDASRCGGESWRGSKHAWRRPVVPVQRCARCVRNIHKTKTASDMAKQAALRRSKVPPKNQSLDGFMSTMVPGSCHTQRGGNVGTVPGGGGQNHQELVSILVRTHAVMGNRCGFY